MLRCTVYTVYFSKINLLCRPFEQATDHLIALHRPLSLLKLIPQQVKQLRILNCLSKVLSVGEDLKFRWLFLGIHENQLVIQVL
jgi:hypothetical protein